MEDIRSLGLSCVSCANDQDIRSILRVLRLMVATGLPRITWKMASKMVYRPGHCPEIPEICPEMS